MTATADRDMSSSLLRADAQRVFGRGREVDELVAVVERMSEGAGGAILITGDAGIGKSCIVEELTAHAHQLGARVLRAVGVQSEAHLPFAGLHQLLDPIMPLADTLPTRLHAALHATFGLLDEESPQVFLIGLAALELIGEAAASTPALLIVEDAHWLDQSSCELLAFVARRLEAEPAAMVVTTRTGHGGPLAEAGLAQLPLGALDAISAGRLLDERTPGLPPSLRQRLLDLAAGNPLALVELPAGLRSGQLAEQEPLPALLPLTSRLERAFACQAAQLSAAAQALLLVAAADDRGRLHEVLAAASIVVGREVTVDAVEEVVAIGLVTVEQAELRFRHPLVRSSTYQAASLSERVVAHSALAEVLVSQQDRRVWHRAAASLGPDDNIAQELDRAADEADRRGAMALVIAARERASELSEDAGGRAHRLLQAAEVAYGLGEVPLGNRLARSVEPEALEEEERSRCRWLLEIHDDQWSVRTTASVPVAEIVGRMCADGQGDLAWQWLLKVAITYWWDNPAESARTAVVAAAADAGLPVNESTRLAVLAHADPVRCGPGVVERIAAMAPDGLDPVDAFRLGAAANAAWAYEEALPFLSASTSGLRSQGRMGLLAEALAAQAWAAVHLAREPLAVSAAEEAVRLGRETGQPRCVASAQLAQASIAAERGEMEVAEAIIAEAEALLAPIGATSMLALVQFVRGRGAVAHQRYAEGLDHLQRLLDPADPLLQPFVGAWGLSDLVEAAAHSGRHDLAEDYLAQLEQLAATTSAPFLTATAGYARAMVASDDVAEAAYQAAIEGDLANWPCYRGRMLLWYGRWLRRQRRTVESRTPLRAARQAFDVLAFPRLAEAARLELRASGEVSRRRVSGGWDRLTPQELQIARLAATGLTNREIGDRLYLSHRTVGYHLHRVFPKLGITSRNQLDPVVLDAVEELA